MKLTLKPPLKNMILTQKFGNKNPKLYGSMGHNGLDFFAGHGKPIYASTDGFASYQVDNGGGHGVVLITDKEYESIDGVSSFWKTIYWHLPDPLKEPNLKSPFADKTGFTQVKCGDIIGYVDNTGNSTGDHLHFGLKPVAKGENWGTWMNIEQGNGYFGAVDPLPYLELELPPENPKKTKIKELQTLLNKWGATLVIDGLWGKLSNKALQDFLK